MELLCKGAVRQRSWAQSEQCWAQSNQSVRDAACSSRAQVALQSYCLSFCMELLCKSFLLNIVLKLLFGFFGTVVQKLACEGIPQDNISISIPWRCNVFLSNRSGLGRSLSHVGSSQISLFMMLHGSVVHKLPFAAASVGVVLILMTL